MRFWGNRHALEDYARGSFRTIQAAWCEQDLATLQKLLLPELFEEWKAQIQELKSQGHRNVIDDLLIKNLRLVEAKNFRDPEKDTFTACIDAEATDYTVDQNGAIVHSNSASRRKRAHHKKSLEKFREFWTYQRHAEHWLLARVDQSSAWNLYVGEPLVDETSQPEASPGDASPLVRASKPPSA